ncbi:PGF-CTERM sorting domain-containing protein [Halorussus salinisoli]|uniref:PGF-CTERM sorting domain-containing protein n=1 Tax=Halorussus salinisoli TaxID=2558242 RepID=UPI0010C1AF8F|nr:PGF-CTERM sorting domain-containing protein [Halorussus salinisoli]
MAVVLTAVVVSGSFTAGLALGKTTEGGTADVPESTGLNVPDTTIVGNSDSTIEIAYNASKYVEDGTVTQSDLAVNIAWPGGGEFQNLDSKKGTQTITVPADTITGGTHVLTGVLINASSGRLVGSDGYQDTGTLVAQTDLTVEGFTLSNSTITEGDSVTVTTTVDNPTTNTDSITLSVYNERGRSLASDSISVSGTTQEDVTLTPTFNYSGTYNIRVNGQPAKTLTVESTDDSTEQLLLTETNISSSIVRTGENLTITGTVENQGGSSGEYTFDVDVFPRDGSSSWEKSTTVSVPADGTETVSLNVSFAEAGSYDVSAGGNLYTVDAVAGEKVDLEMNDVAPNQTVVVGQGTSFFATAENPSDSQGWENVTLTYKDGTVIDSKGVTVPAKGQADVNFYDIVFPSTGEYTVFLDGEQINVTVREPVIVNSSARVIGGPTLDSDVQADLSMQSGMLQGDIEPTSGSDLSSIGATTNTRVSVSLVVENFSAPVLIATGHNVTWNRTQINETHTRYEINITAAEWQYLNGAHLNSWPNGSADQATSMDPATISLTFDPMTSYPGSDERRAALNGTIIATDAQTFGTPQFKPGGPDTDPTLSLLVAGPHLTVNGSENKGFYEAYLPNNLLSSWGVSDPSTLQAAYNNSSRDLSISRHTDNGVYVSVPIHYSKGTVVVSKADDQEETTTTTTSTSSSETTTSFAGTPGFEVTGTLLALLTALLLIKRRHV